MRRGELDGRHHDLAIEVDRLHLVTAAPDDALPEPRMRAVVTHELGELCATLVEHFSAEEANLAELLGPSDDDDDVAGLAGLREGHLHILAQFRHLAEVCHDLPIDVLKLRVADILDLLADHERTEGRWLDPRVDRD